MTVSEVSEILKVCKCVMAGIAIAAPRCRRRWNRTTACPVCCCTTATKNRSSKELYGEYTPTAAPPPGRYCRDILAGVKVLVIYFQTMQQKARAYVLMVPCQPYLAGRTASSPLHNHPDVVQQWV